MPAKKPAAQAADTQMAAADRLRRSFWGCGIERKIPDGGSGGTTQAETRVYNERLVLSLIRRHGQLSKADLTRLTGLAAQTMTTIVNRATENGLLVRREPLRGRLGQPSVPYALNPEGAFAFGLKIDHRSADVVLVDFVGNVVAVERTTFPIPSPREIVSFARSAIARIHRRHRTVAASRSTESFPDDQPVRRRYSAYSRLRCTTSIFRHRRKLRVT